MTNFTAELENRVTAAQFDKSAKDWRMPSSNVISVYTDRKDSEGPRINCSIGSRTGNWGNRVVIPYNAMSMTTSHLSLTNLYRNITQR